MRPASDVERRRLNETFARLCAIPSPFGSERACAEAVARELGRMGVDVEEDGAAAEAGAECGNLLARIPGRGDRTILLCAHLDTVPEDGTIEPVIDDGAWVSAGETILGADNKAAVAVILEVARRCSVEGAPVGLELLFTVGEEKGLAGALAFDVSTLTSDWGYVFDHASPIGEIVVSSPTYYRFEASFRGAAAHAGIRPEDGRSAIEASARAIAAMTLGRIDHETTANVASIAGGAGGTNIVPEHCTIVGEVRSLDPLKAEAVIAELIDHIHDAANTPHCACDVDVTTSRALRRLPPPAERARRAGRRAGPALARVRAAAPLDGRRVGRQRVRVQGLCVHEPRQRHPVQPRAPRARQRGRARGHARRDLRAAGRMLRLKRAIVLNAGPPGAMEQRLAIRIGDGERRAAIADVGLVGASQPGDEVIVNVEAVELGLGSGGFDVVHVNLSRGLDGEGTPRAHVMKLNYTSLQHAVAPVEEGDGDATPAPPSLPIGRPVAVLALHGQLAPLAWAYAQRSPGSRLGYVQTAGGALPGGHSCVVRDLRDGGLLAGHLTAGPAFGGADGEAITTAAALHHGFAALGWDAAVAGPGPGILGSGSALGHGGLQALDSAHTALALGCPTLLVARMSSTDLRARHRGLSHHSRVVLELLLASVAVAVPAGERIDGVPPRADEEAGAGRGPGSPAASEIARHDWRECGADLDGYLATSLPSRSMGREDPLFFAAALAAGTALADLRS